MSLPFPSPPSSPSSYPNPLLPTSSSPSTSRFEHVMDETGSGGDGAWKLHLLLSRMLEVLHRFPGCVVLLVNVDQPQNISLQVHYCIPSSLLSSPLVFFFNFTFMFIFLYMHFVVLFLYSHVCFHMYQLPPTSYQHTLSYSSSRINTHTHTLIHPYIHIYTYTLPSTNTHTYTHSACPCLNMPTPQRDFAAKLFSFLRFSTPPHAIRARIWASLMPRGAPLCRNRSRND